MVNTEEEEQLLKLSNNMKYIAVINWSGVYLNWKLEGRSKEQT